MGAGLASVMSNLQVVVVLLAAWLIWDERPSARQAVGIPIALVGIILISGILDASAFGSDPVAGSILGILVAISYAAYLLLIRKGRDLEHAAGPILDATLACALAAVAAGLVTGGLELAPSLPGHAWLILLALSAQVAGSVTDRRRPATPARGHDLPHPARAAGARGVPRHAHPGGDTLADAAARRRARHRRHPARIGVQTGRPVGGAVAGPEAAAAS